MQGREQKVSTRICLKSSQDFNVIMTMSHAWLQARCLKSFSPESSWKFTKVCWAISGAVLYSCLADHTPCLVTESKSYVSLKPTPFPQWSNVCVNDWGARTRAYSITCSATPLWVAKNCRTIFVLLYSVEHSQKLAINQYRVLFFLLFSCDTCSIKKRSFVCRKGGARA